jgi:hypothetical protein
MEIGYKARIRSEYKINLFYYENNILTIDKNYNFEYSFNWISREDRYNYLLKIIKSISILREYIYRNDNYVYNHIAEFNRLIGTLVTELTFSDHSSEDKINKRVFDWLLMKYQYMISVDKSDAMNTWEAI